MVVENVCGAQKWVGRARWHHGSFFLWGDVPALMPMTTRCGVKVGGMDWNGSDKPGYKAVALRRHSPCEERRRLLVLSGGKDWQGEAPRPRGTAARKAAAARIARIHSRSPGTSHRSTSFFPAFRRAADHARMPRVRLRLRLRPGGYLA